MASVATASSWGANQVPTHSNDEREIQLETVCCPGCSGSGFREVLSVRDELTELGGEFVMQQCTSCDLIITNPRPAPDSLGYFYPSEYMPYAPEKQKSSWHRLLEQSALRCQFGYPKQPVNLLTRLFSLLAMQKFNSRRKRHDWFPYRPDGKLLDVGCGGGSFLERMKGFGWDVCGLELAADVAQRVQNRTGIKVHVGTLPHTDLEPHSFDAVTLWHVLEHVPQPREFLKSAAALLRPNGLLVIEVPNIDSWSFETFGPHWTGLEVPRHFQHFNPKTLGAMLPAGAFRNVEILQLGTRSLIKESAERAVAAGRREYADWLKQGKRFFSERAAWTESNNRADVIRLTAERI